MKGIFNIFKPFWTWRRKWEPKKEKKSSEVPAVVLLSVKPLQEPDVPVIVLSPTATKVRGCSYDGATESVFQQSDELLKQLKGILGHCKGAQDDNPTDINSVVTENDVPVTNADQSSVTPADPFVTPLVDIQVSSTDFDDITGCDLCGCKRLKRKFDKWKRKRREKKKAKELAKLDEEDMKDPPCEAY